MQEVSMDTCCYGNQQWYFPTTYKFIILAIDDTPGPEYLKQRNAISQEGANKMYLTNDDIISMHFLQFRLLRPTKVLPDHH